MKSRSKAFYKEATKNLSIAKEELFKPEEDVVSYSICKNAQFAVENFLKGFLVDHGVAIELDDTLESLYKKCLAVDEHFKTVDLHAFTCSNQTLDSRYCSEISKVSSCYDTADQIDTLLRKKKII
jgi:hypothetical protein